MLPFNPAGRLDGYTTDIDQTDFQLQQAEDIGRDLHLRWGVEQAREARGLVFLRSFDSALAPALSAVLTNTIDRRLESLDACVSARCHVRPQLELQGDLVHQRYRADTVMSDRLDLTGVGNLLDTPTPERDRISELNPRLGLAFAPAPGQKLRVVLQRWRRTAGNGSLGPVDTLGIPLEDRLVESGGLARRTRVQYDWHTGSDSFLQAFANHRQVRNLASATTAQFRVFGVSELDALRARKPVFGEAFDDLEKTPGLPAGPDVQRGPGRQLAAQPQPDAGRKVHAVRPPQQRRGLQRQRRAVHPAPLRQP